jgi:hypothetical protein
MTYAYAVDSMIRPMGLGQNCHFKSCAIKKLPFSNSGRQKLDWCFHLKMDSNGQFSDYADIFSFFQYSPAIFENRIPQQLYKSHTAGTTK